MWINQQMTNLRIWDLIVAVPDHCLSFYYMQYLQQNLRSWRVQNDKWEMTNLPAILSASPAFLGWARYLTLELNKTFCWNLKTRDIILKKSRTSPRIGKRENSVERIENLIQMLVAYFILKVFYCASNLNIIKTSPLLGSWCHLLLILVKYTFCNF